MQIRVDKLRKTMALLQPVVPKKPTLPILTNVLVMNGKLVATDLETSVAIAVPEAQGSFLIPIRPVMDLIKFVPGDEILTIEPSATAIKLSWPGGSASYDVKMVEDYPSLTAGERKAEGSVNGDMLVGALAAALPYCATETTRPILTGVTIYLGETVIVTGADGFRLSYQELKMSYPVQDPVIMPAEAIHILEILWRKSPAVVPMATNLISQITAVRQLKLCLRAENLMEFQFGKVSMFCNPIVGTPVDYLNFVKSFKEPTKIMFMSTELYTVARRLANIASSSAFILRMQWTEKTMTVSAQSSDVGASTAEVPLLSASAPGRVALNANNLLDYLAGKNGFVTMGSIDRTSPVIFHYGSTPTVAIMPMQAEWDDEKPPEPPPGQDPPEEQQVETSTGDIKENVEEEERPDEETTEPGEGDEEGTEEETETPDPPPEVKPKRRGRQKKT